MSGYKTTIGLEVHAELKTNSKMFCGCKNDPHENAPNKNICPVCTAQPGTLPVINKEALRHVLRVGASVGAKLADFSEFDRKNYFYPDIPKGYQISQYKYPLVSGGSLNGVLLTRIHLEEDTARSVHDKGNYTLVDYNRAGLPLMELVTEPVVHSAEQAVSFAKELQLLLRYLGASDANMEEGQMRVEANISVSKTEKFGTKVEVKNLNSFRAVEGAINFEVARHIEALERGEIIKQETRGWNEDKQSTFSQRAKENAHDYRYFPDPDLPKLKLSEVKEFTLSEIQKSLPELPWERRERLKKFDLKDDTVKVFVESQLYGNFFDEVSKYLSSEPKSVEVVQLAANYITSDLVSLGGGVGVGKVDSLSFSKLMKMVKSALVSSRGAKDILAILYAEGGDAESLAKTKGLLQQSDTGALEEIVKQVILSNQKVADEFKAGKAASLQFLVGQGMKVSKGSANPQVLAEIFKKILTQVT